MVEYVKEIGQNFIHYTFEIDNEKIRLVCYQKMGKSIDDIDSIPYAIFGKIVNESEKFPKFGISYIPTLIEKSILIENIVNCLNDFINNHNNVRYSFLKVLKTENLIDKANDYNSKVLEVLGENNVEIKAIENFKRKGQKIESTHEYILTKK